MPPRIRVGTIGWNYPEWRGLVYPRDAKPPEFLARYAERYSLVEAGSSYYGMPRSETITSWAARTPAGFEIAMKVPEWILKREGEDLASALRTFLGRLGPLAEAGKLGPLVLQLHPSFTREKKADALAALLHALPEGPVWAVELRHASWWRDETYDLLREAGATLVWSDLGKMRTPAVVTSDALYLRLFGDRVLEPPYDRKRRDAASTLALWAERIRGVAGEVARVDVLVSKYLEGYAPASAATLMEMLGLEAHEAHAPRQMRLEDVTDLG
jgi:uncharacterized protein YecE (DUF72 family)